jgi:hypothetical protein
MQKKKFTLTLKDQKFMLMKIKYNSSSSPYLVPTLSKPIQPF